MESSSSATFRPDAAASGSMTYPGTTATAPATTSKTYYHHHHASSASSSLPGSNHNNGSNTAGGIWKVRDAAEVLLHEHAKLLVQDDGIDESNNDNDRMTTAMMPLSSSFDAVTCLHRIRRDKADVVKFAFTEAATAVLRAITKQQKQQQGTTDEAGLLPDASQSMLSEGKNDLPAVLRDQVTLEVMRIKSLERAHNNKEYTKRKGAKTDLDEEAVAVAVQVETNMGATSQLGASTAAAALPSTNTNTTTTAGITSTTTPVSILKTTPAKPTSSTSGAAAATTATTTTKSGASHSNSKGTSSDERPKFTRNTPASSAAALDFRFNSARAILCAAGNVTFEALTPPLPGHDIDVLHVPQNPSLQATAKANATSPSATATTTVPAGSSSSSSSGLVVNMGAVMVEAKTLGQRTISVVENAVRRSSLRYQYRKDNARYDRHGCGSGSRGDNKDLFVRIANPFSAQSIAEQEENKLKDLSLPPHAVENDSDSVDDDHNDDATIPHAPAPGVLTQAWSTQCLPRFLSVLATGAGHAVYHDTQWKTRHGRLAHLFRALSKQDGDDANFGPHLIVTVEPELYNFAQEFHDCTGHFDLLSSNPNKSLLVLPYHGSKQRRRKLRKQFFPQAKGLSESPFHVLVTSYASFLQDYLHFCQVPFEVVVLDDGVSWMAAAHGDQNAAIGSIWENGIWSANDQHIGLAGTGYEEWDFSLDVLPDSVIKEAWVGLTARHRIMTSATLTVEQKQSSDLVPVSGLVSFVAPHFAGVVREEWDRSRVASDASSMDHFRKLFARSMVVHSPEIEGVDMLDLALMALTGKLDCEDRDDPIVPRMVYDDAFVSDGKINFSRRASLIWLGQTETSWLRFELGEAKLQNILDAMKISNKHGHFCEEITTASTLTSSGATGQVAGTMAYRLAVRCGRHFGSEQGLRQHVSALHAPPGTWLCRSCGSDCITSQARTHHERSCGQPSAGAPFAEQSNTVGATPTVGQGGSGKSGVGKKKANRSAALASQSGAAEEKDPDGSFRVPGYRGVWVNKAGKHFVKIDGQRLTMGDRQENLLLFDHIDDAAKKYDETVKEKKAGQKVELNFKPDGSRIIYEDIAPASTSGLGGSAASVVPALSIINIKVRTLCSFL